MSQLTAGEYDVTLNGVKIHYTVRGKVREFGMISQASTISSRLFPSIHAARVSLDLRPGTPTYYLITPLTSKRSASIWDMKNRSSWVGHMEAWSSSNSRSRILTRYRS